MKSSSRVARVESALSPKQMVLLEIQGMLRHTDFVTAVREEVSGRLSAPTLCERIERAVRQSIGKAQARVLGARIVESQREGLFLARLFTECSCAMLQRLREWELETALVHAIAALEAGAICRKRPIAGLEEVDRVIENVLCNIRAHLRAAERIGNRYFDGVDICFSGARARMEGMIKQLDQLSRTYRLAREDGGPKKGHNDRGPAGAARIEEMADELARTWILFVRAQVHGDLGETAKAAALGAELLTVSSPN